MLMYKKLTFLFVTTFVIALAFFSSYFVIQEVRGVVNIGGILEMNNHSIANLGFPTVPADLVTKGYLKNVGSFYLGAGSIESWCEVQGFAWCTSGYVECGDGICNGDETYLTCTDCPPPPPNGNGCFTAETQILMADGKYKPIKDVGEGDWILTKENEKSDKMVSAKVARASKHTVDNYLVINNELKVTGNHPIFVNNNWKQAGTVELGDKLFNEEGQEVIVESLELKRETIKVYNLELEDSQAYFPAYFAGGIYVHNVLKNGDPEP